MPITVSIVEDDSETRKRLLALLGIDARIACLNTYGTGEEALAGLSSQPPDVVLMDIKLPGMSGIECVAKLKAKWPKLAILMITTYDQRDLIFDSLRAGASGYLLKNMPASELIQAVEQIHAGGAPMSMQIARKVVDHFHQIEQPVSDVEKLTPREQEILALLARGYFYKEISEKLNVSLSTVATHLRHIYEKLHVQSRTEATARFFGR